MACISSIWISGWISPDPQAERSDGWFSGYLGELSSVIWISGGAVIEPGKKQLAAIHSLETTLGPKLRDLRGSICTDHFLKLFSCFSKADLLDHCSLFGSNIQQKFNNRTGLIFWFWANKINSCMTLKLGLLKARRRLIGFKTVQVYIPCIVTFGRRPLYYGVLQFMGILVG